MANDPIIKIRELLRSFDLAMLVTHGENFPFHARPMAIARVDDNCDVWFFTSRISTKVREVENDERVLVVCQDEMSRYVAVCASARLSSDREQATALWQESYKTWFPKGVEDPELLLVQAQPQHAEFWDNQGFKSVQYLFEAAKAYVSGTRPHIKEGEQHGSVAF